MGKSAVSQGISSRGHPQPEYEVYIRDQLSDGTEDWSLLPQLLFRYDFSNACTEGNMCQRIHLQLYCKQVTN